MANGLAHVDVGDIRRFNWMRNQNDERICGLERHEDKFVRVSEFSGSDIEGYCESMQISELVKKAINLSVRLNVAKPDMERRLVHINGSGIIKHIQTNESPKVEVCTAKHVVSNDNEAKKTRCRLYFDGRESRKVVLKGATESASDLNNDWCKFLCDVDSQEIEQIRENLQTFEIELGNKKRKKMNRKRKVILISHPHGGYKYISMGDQIIEIDGIKYDTPSCKGCSGGYIIPVGYIDRGTYVHSVSYYQGDKRLYGYASGLIPVVRNTMLNT
ncbi:hypothetical protein Bpfe_020604 [Biomphalaria pfeifferi]|uniref:Uncharacterized protein n=1 Tax=Biomphalaria pfeifferi TaxID=112525 RepID=A0AAD8B8P1_BIOPF|nr:hypothetical protein Bpfe_020604 [Biomphalaria pfeifferi]